MLRASRQVKRHAVISSKTRTVLQTVHRITDLVNCGVEDNAKLITLSHEHHTKGVVVFSLFPPPHVPITLSSPGVPCHPVSLLEYPATPSPTTLQISQLHYINLLCLNLLCTVVKNLPIVVG